MAMQILGLLRRVERLAIALLMIAMSLAYVFNVLVREFATVYAPRFAWIEEAALFGLAWLVFLGLGLALERGRHIAMSALFDRLSAAPRRFVGFAINIVGLVFSLYVVKIAIDLTLFVMNSGQISPTLGISMAWLYGALPVGFALLTLRYALELFGVTNRFAIADHGQEPDFRIDLDRMNISVRQFQSQACLQAFQS